MWHNSKYSIGFTLAREVTLDQELGLLLAVPAREYKAMRQAPQVNIQNADVGTARKALQLAARRIPCPYFAAYNALNNKDTLHIKHYIIRTLCII